MTAAQADLSGATVTAILSRLNTGDLIDLLQPEKTRFSMTGVARALSKLCRFAGQTTGSSFYSVAEHSVYVSLLAERMGADPWGALWHETSEGLGLGDVTSPVKTHFAEIERQVETGLLAEAAVQFRFQFPFSPEIHLADRLMCQVEGAALMANWHRQVDPAHEDLIAGLEPLCLEHEQAYELFLTRMKAVATQIKRHDVLLALKEGS